MAPTLLPPARLPLMIVVVEFAYCLVVLRFAGAWSPSWPAVEPCPEGLPLRTCCNVLMWPRKKFYLAPRWAPNVPAKFGQNTKGASFLPVY